MIRRTEWLQIIDSQAASIQRLLDHEVQRVTEISTVPNFANILTGIRRCGKSTWMIQQMRRIPDKKLLYLNFDDIRLSSMDKTDWKRLYEFITEQGYEGLFFDEIQLMEGWEVFVHQLLRESFQVWITGSNATLLSIELGTHLTGRHLSTELFPFSYKEYLTYKNSQPSKETLMSYLLSGGMPDYVKTSDDRILHTVLDDILMRDITVRHNIRDTARLRQLAVYILTNCTKLFSANSLSKTLEIKSVSTVLEYLNYMQDAYLIDIIGMYSYSLKTTLRNPKKIYVMDTGFVTAISLSQSMDTGRLLENMVFMCLRRKYKDHIYYYQDKHECDFIITDDANHPVQAIQVCAELNDENIDREINGLRSAMHAFNLTKGYILTLDESDNVDTEDGTVEIRRIYEWDG